jgi:putative tributyrin esterase
MIERRLDAQTVELIHPSQALGRDRKRCIVVSPPDAAERGPLPVCYFLHGWGGNAQSYLAHARIREAALAAPHHTVFPESFRRWFINDHEGHRYEDYLVEELVPAVDAWLDAVPTPEMRAIGGFSMGGCAAFVTAVRHTDVFGATFCHAGAFEAPRREGDPYAHLREQGVPLLMPTQADHESVWGPLDSAVRDEYDPYLLIKRMRPEGLHIYLDIGLDDYPRMIQMNRSFHQALLAANVPHEFYERPGGHDLDYVGEALPHSVRFLSRVFTRTAVPALVLAGLPEEVVS